MKSLYVILLMGAAAIAGGLVVRYGEHPARITPAGSVPPAVVAPPTPPAGHVGPSGSMPFRSAPAGNARKEYEKPSALSLPVHIGRPDPAPVETPAHHPAIVARTYIPPDPPAIFPLGHTVAPQVAPSLEPSPAPVPEPKVTAAAAFPQPAAQPAPNRVTLKPGMLISVRINEALSSDRSVRGDPFTGILDRPLIVDGFVIAERGSRVRGQVMNSSHADPADGRAELTLQLQEFFTSDGQQVHVVTQPWRRQGAFSSDRNVNPGDGAVTRYPASIMPGTSIPFRVDQAVEITEKRP